MHIQIYLATELIKQAIDLARCTEISEELLEALVFGEDDVLDRIVDEEDLEFDLYAGWRDVQRDMIDNILKIKR